MTSTNGWHSIIASESHLSPDAARLLRDIGFVVMPGPVIPGGYEQFSEAYNRAVDGPQHGEPLRTATRKFSHHSRGSGQKRTSPLANA